VDPKVEFMGRDYLLSSGSETLKINTYFGTQKVHVFLKHFLRTSDLDVEINNKEIRAIR